MSAAQLVNIAPRGASILPIGVNINPAVILVNPQGAAIWVRFLLLCTGMKHLSLGLHAACCWPRTCSNAQMPRDSPAVAVAYMFVC